MKQKKMMMALLCAALLLPAMCFAGAGEWIWMGGDNETGAAGVYGIKGMPASDNYPGARASALSWTDAEGNLWLFGGDAPYGFDFFNDLWRYDPSSGVWTWMSGDNATNQTAVFGIKGIPDENNVPGARWKSVSWTDSSGNLWLFGGWAFNFQFSFGPINDMWRYEPSSGMWTWMSGANTHNQSGVYGTQGTPDSNNVPGARDDSVSWTDNSGNLWLFGGQGLDVNDNSGRLNDLWRYNVASGVWTWMSGDNATNQSGVYGTQGTPESNNVPGARYRSFAWTDSSGNLWLFGGQGYDSTGISGVLNDLWRYNISTGLWTWMSGSEFSGQQAGVYGIKGIPDDANVPGPRYSGVAWADGEGSLWLFGGYGFDSTGNSYSYLNDLWRYTINTGLWTWIGGSAITGQSGSYGTLGTPNANTIPGARYLGVSWFDNAGNFWMFGGYGLDAEGSAAGYLNDLWHYELPGCMGDEECDDNVFCTGQEICDNGTCVSLGDPCAFDSLICDEVNQLCVECFDDGDCSDNLTCTDGVCLFPCALSIKYKEIKSDKLSKPRKRAFFITGGEDFDPYGTINFEPFEIIKSKVKDRKQILKIKAIVPVGLEPGWLPVSVGTCYGEIEITGTIPQ